MTAKVRPIPGRGPFYKTSKKHPPGKKPQAPFPNAFDRLDHRLRSYVPLAKAVMPYILPAPDALEARYGIQSFATGGEWRIFERPRPSFSPLTMVAMHLAGDFVLATPFEGDVQYIEIDLDAKDMVTARSLRERAQTISRIFERDGSSTGIMWGSTSSTRPTSGSYIRLPFRASE